MLNIILDLMYLEFVVTFHSPFYYQNKRPMGRIAHLSRSAS